MTFVVSQRTGIALMLAFGLASACSAQAQGTIVYHQPSIPLYPLIGQELDLDGDGELDLGFHSATQIGASFFGTGGSGIGTAHLLVTPQDPSGIGSYLIGLSVGFQIGSTPPVTLFWAARDAPNGNGQPIVLGTWLPAEGNQLIPSGFFYNITAFMGIHFQIGEDWHYGWVRIRGEGGEDMLAPQGWILDWAYESRPDTPIFAGAVPEPSIFALLTLGVLLFARRWKNN